jgi:hypothetical protein
MKLNIKETIGGALSALSVVLSFLLLGWKFSFIIILFYIGHNLEKHDGTD